MPVVAKHPQQLGAAGSWAAGTAWGAAAATHRGDMWCPQHGIWEGEKAPFK